VAGMRGADARSRENDRPEGVVLRLQVSRNKIDPCPSNRAFNLFAKNELRAALADEPVEGGPQVPLVVKPSAAACAAERLARAAGGPDGTIVWPTGVSQGVGLDADAGEEVALVVASEIIRGNIDN